MKTSTHIARASWMKIGVTGAILIGAASIVGSGAFAVWTSSATANAAVNAGAIKINLTDTNITLDGMAPGDTVDQLLPISFAQSTNVGSLVSAIQFSVSAPAIDDITGVNPATSGTAGYHDGSGSSLFTGSVAATEIRNLDHTIAYPEVLAHSSALTYTIKTCSVQWTKDVTTNLYACTGIGARETDTAVPTTATALNTIQKTSPLTLTPADFDSTSTAGTFNAGDVNLYSIISITLPSTANNSFINSSVKLVFNVAAIQRAAITTSK